MGAVEVDSNGRNLRFATKGGPCRDTIPWSFEAGLRRSRCDRPAKSLFLFLEQLWIGLNRRQIHPGFDIRTYMSDELDLVVEADP